MISQPLANPLSMFGVKGKSALITGATGAFGRAIAPRSLGRIPLGRLGKVEDLMGMALYLLSPASDFCTGQIMYVDSGYTAG